MTEYRDPGWKAALRRWPMFFLPVPTLTFPVLQRRGAFDSVTALRILWCSFVTTLLMILFIVLFMGLASKPPSGDQLGGAWYLVFLLPIQLGALGGVLWTRSRPLDTSSEEKLAVSYRTFFFVGVAFAESIALFGFVGVFLVGELWPYLEGLPLGLLGLALVAPTSGDIARRQQEITARGSALSLVDALMRLGPPLGR